MKKQYIVRHGQTVWNLEKRKQGQKDSPLTIKGIEQAKMVAKTLKEEIPDLQNYQFVISPQWRCQQYASIICELLDKDFSDCILEEDIREHSFGLWEGKVEPEIEKQFPGFLARRYKSENYWSYIVPKGESYEILYNRVSAVVNKYRKHNVVFICHEMVSKVMRGNLLNLKPEEILPLNHKQDLIYKFDGELTTLQVNNR